MGAQKLLCHRCQTSLPEDPAAVASLVECPVCRAGLFVRIFPARAAGPDPSVAALATVDAGEAACFFHPQKQAVVPCDHCGRFLCALCDFPIGERHLCANCVSLSEQQREGGVLERSRVRWDQVVWYLLILPMLLCAWLVPLTAPTALVLAILKRNTPPSLVQRSRLLLQLAIPAAVLELAGIVAAIWYAANR